MKKLAWLVLVLVFLMFYSHAVKHVLNGGEKLGVLTKPFTEFVNFISTSEEVFSQIEEDSKKGDYFKKENIINNLESDFFTLNCVYESVNIGWSIELRNLKNDSVHYKWWLNESDFIETYIVPSRRIIMHPLLMPDSSIIIHGENTQTLYKIDKDSKLIWKKTGIRFHHAVNEDGEGNIWCCTKDDVFVKQFNRWGISYLDQGIAKLDAETGEVLYEKSISDILIENDLYSILLGSNNGDGDSGRDPMHLNDAEVVTKDGPYMKKGDVFMSIRNRSTILHYRPSTNEVIKVIQGPFLCQHDIDIHNDSLVSIFNNNKSGVGPEDYFRLGYDTVPSILELTNSNIVEYNYASGEFSKPGDQLLKDNRFFTHDQGLHEKIDGIGWALENQNHSELMIFDGDRVIYDGPIAIKSDSTKQELRWCRYYTNLDFLKNE